MTRSFPLRRDQAAQHVDVPPGGEIVLRGKLVCSTDGSIVDAATTTWPAGAPGGASVDSGGLVDFAQGGFHVTRRDPEAHEVHAVATGGPAPACALAGVEAPCLPLRLLPLARMRLQTARELSGCLKGGITVEVPGAVVPPVPPGAAPYVQGAAVLLGVGALAAIGWAAQRRRARSPSGQLIALARRTRAKLRRADPVVAAPLAPAVEAALGALKQRGVDAASAEGRRIAEVLRRVEVRLDASVVEARADREQRIADELVREVESALEAVDEVAAARRDHR
ncbi:hypothetical protein SOCEGT47_084550 [Sorangium cellulosum]|uniref:Uncharacterized protein n=1 Tax=Sorangium cellulosum TaxID=56 RepID=A0A4P2QDI9_SORCE|nr:hypothetical protein [Sorangium cellulosum]AUX27857.1 hypothetical protein SOCEGT47_084550 [Sorangium cellulosum]